MSVIFASAHFLASLAVRVRRARSRARLPVPAGLARTLARPWVAPNLWKSLDAPSLVSQCKRFLTAPCCRTCTGRSACTRPRTTLADNCAPSSRFPSSLPYKRNCRPLCCKWLRFDTEFFTKKTYSYNLLRNAFNISS